MSECSKQLPMNNKNLAPKQTYLRKLYAPWQLTQTFGSLKHCHVLLMRQVRSVRSFKVAVLNLHVIMMKPEIKLIILAARLYTIGLKVVVRAEALPRDIL